MTMFRPVGARFARSVFGLLTIWCLGCASLDSVIQQLTGFGDRSTAACMTANESAPPSVEMALAPQPKASQTGDAGCGCTQCVGVETAPLSLVAAAQPTPDTFAETLGGPLSDNREPLVPPPQGLSIG